MSRIISKGLIQLSGEIDIQSCTANSSDAFLWWWPFDKDRGHLIHLDADVVKSCRHWLHPHILRPLFVVVLLFDIDSVVFPVYHVQKLATRQDLVFVSLVVYDTDEWLLCVFDLLGIRPGIELSKCFKVPATNWIIAVIDKLAGGLGRRASESTSVGVGTLVQDTKIWHADFL